MLAFTLMLLFAFSATAQKVECNVGAKTYKIEGRINHDTWDKSQSSRVIFTGIPATLEEFKQVRQTLGKEPQGAVALQVMAFEMFRRNRTVGEQALRLNNTATNYNSTIERLKEMMGKDKYYARPYLAAALLDGANPSNAYTPKSPYCVKIRVNPANKYQESQFLGGTVIYLQIDSEGHQLARRRGCETRRGTILCCEQLPRHVHPVQTNQGHLERAQVKQSGYEIFSNHFNRSCCTDVVAGLQEH